ncbi:MAG: hypothetical protein CMJ49_09240 [Planctomycetaceae bacterium]|nr:hypothetical protein [Planctomycetaceae bacterium]
MHGLKDFAYNTSALPLTCALLDKGASLIHAGAISVDGQGVLMPAWGGVGKSLLVSQSVLHGRAKFLADDHAVIDRQGDLHLHLLPIHIYKYHTSDAVLAQRLLGSLGAGDRLNWRVGCRLRPRRAVRWVAPQTLYTEARLERTARLNQVVLMFRGDHSDFVWEEVDPESGARCCAGVLFDEIRQMAERLALGAAGWERGPLPQLHDAYAGVIDVLTGAFGHAAVHRTLIPRGAAAGDVVAFVRKSCPLIDQAFDEAP